MSHHLDSELARQDPRLDISDVYLFRGTLGTVLVMNVDPMSGRHGFHPEGLYEFKLDFDGAGTDVGAIVLELADDVVPASTVGFWGVTVLATDAGGWRQINRCAQPLINTLFELEDGDRGIDFNATQPSEDRALYGPRIVRDT